LCLGVFEKKQVSSGGSDFDQLEADGADVNFLQENGLTEYAELEKKAMEGTATRMEEISELQNISPIQPDTGGLCPVTVS
jgi:hypothetical protein